MECSFAQLIRRLIVDYRLQKFRWFSSERLLSLKELCCPEIFCKLKQTEQISKPRTFGFFRSKWGLDKATKFKGPGLSPNQQQVDDSASLLRNAWVSQNQSSPDTSFPKSSGGRLQNGRLAYNGKTAKQPKCLEFKKIVEKVQADHRLSWAVRSGL